MTDGARFRFVAGGQPAAAIGAVDLYAADLGATDGLLVSLGIAPLPPGAVALRSFGGVDEGIAARWSGTAASLFPHAGAAVLEGVRRWLLAAGLAPNEQTDPLALYPESGGIIEACALDAIGRAESALAIDTVLKHRDFWIRHGAGAPVPEADPLSQRRLDRLLTAPLVAVVGPPNIGKSSLTNALARRAVSVVADEPGTTRDHVGVTLDFGGLSVRWVDTPGAREDTGDAEEARALELARSVVRSAALVIDCADASTGAAPAGAVALVPSGALRVAVWTRADLNPRVDRGDSGRIRTSARTGEGLDQLAAAVREALVPRSVLECSERWRFHACLP